MRRHLLVHHQHLRFPLGPRVRKKTKLKVDLAPLLGVILLHPRTRPEGQVNFLLLARMKTSIWRREIREEEEVAEGEAVVENLSNQRVIRKSSEKSSDKWNQHVLIKSIDLLNQ